MWRTEKCPRQKLLENNQQYLIIKAVKLGQFPRQCLVRLAPVLKTGGGGTKKKALNMTFQSFFSSSKISRTNSKTMIQSVLNL